MRSIINQQEGRRGMWVLVPVTYGIYDMPS